MTEFILGPAGSGKTMRIRERILIDLDKGRHVILLVPEQAAVRVEAAISDAAQARSIPQTELEVLNFRRLCNRVFRQYGGISYHGMNKGAKVLLLWQAFVATVPLLKRYAAEAEDPNRFLPLLMSTLDECKTYGITPTDLMRASTACEEENVRLSEKLYDLALLASAYASLFGEGKEDPADDLTRLDETLKRHAFFEGVSLYVDGFVGFTPQEYRILAHGIRQASDTTLSFCHNDEESLAFDNARRELKQLMALCRNHSPKLTRLDGSCRFVADELRYLERNLWSVGEYTPYEGESPAISTVLATDPYDEAEFVASDISRRLREGAVYRDFAVIAGDLNRYDGIINVIFRRYGLPCHMNKRVPLADRPLFKLFLSALNIKNGGWRTDDVITFLKTGLAGIPSDAIDELEEYATQWRIVGSRWYSDEPWCMNPGGYTDRMTDEDRALLNRVNAIRKQIVVPLIKLHESLDEQRTVSEICRAVYTFLEELEIPNRLAATGENEDVLLWNRFCDALDTLVDILPEQKANAKVFTSLFGLVVDQTDTGTIPATVDEIAVGSADRIRADGVKHVYLIGVNEGIFPAATSEKGLFSDNEKAILEGCDIILSPYSNTDAVDELFRFYRAATTASHSLTVLSAKADLSGTALKPSLAWERIVALFPRSQPINTDKMPPLDRLINGDAAMDWIGRLRGTPEGDALRRVCREDPRYAPLLDDRRQPMTVAEETLDAETVALLFPGDIALTQSRLDSYVLCAFGYECTYVLKLKEPRQADFRPADTGNLIHRILERFFLTLTKDGGEIPALTDEEIDRLIDKILDEYLVSIFGEHLDQSLSARALQLFRRLRRSVRILIRNLLDEFKESEFTPRFFELPIRCGDGEDGVAPLTIPLPDGTKAYIYGIADRVDICRRDRDVLVRVVDYKTGSKDFSLYDVSLGLNLQMLLYLFSIWKDGTGSFRRAVECEGEIVPAGVLYCTAKTAEVSATTETSDAEIYEKAAATLKRKGLLLDDEEVLRLMEKKLAGKYIPVTVKKDGSLSTSLTLESLAGMGKLMDEISETVARIATEIKQGVATCRPMKTAKHDACRFCPHRSICRNPAAFETAY